MSMPTPSFKNDDEAAQHWLTVLRDGDREQKIEARAQLAGIFDRREMLEEAVDLLEGNGRAGVRTRELFTHLASLYRRVGRDDDAVAAIAEAAILAEPPVAKHPVPAAPPVVQRPARKRSTVRLIGFGCLGCGGLSIVMFIALAIFASQLPKPTATPTAVAVQPTTASAPASTDVPAAAPQPALPPEPTVPAPAPTVATALPTAAAKPAPPTAPQRSPEVLLAIIQHGGGIQPSDPRVAAFAQQLDKLEAKCTEDRGKLADLTAGANKAMADRGTTEPILNTLSGVATASEALPSEQSCIDLFTTYALLRVNSVPAATPPRR